MESDKELYRRLREFSAERLWNEEVPRFDRASPRERMQQVALIRAVGVVFSATAPAALRESARAWLRGLLQDPAAKIRRYAAAALPKIGARAADESALIDALRGARDDGERASVARSLAKVGGAATLAAVADGANLPGPVEQKVRAGLARRERPGAVRLEAVVRRIDGLRLHLRGRRGLEEIVRDEAAAFAAVRGGFRVLESRPGLVALAPTAPFALRDLFAMRCFGTAGFVLGVAPGREPAECADALADIIASPLARYLFTTLSEGAMRYRLAFAGRGHQRGAVQRVASLAYARCPDILNDPRLAPWAVDVHAVRGGLSVELRPRLSPDPRLSYRTDDVDASSHPPLAACMARLAGRVEGDVVWDPFCGAGLELIERALRGGVRRIVGTDLSPEAVAIARANFAAAGLGGIPTTLLATDFRDPRVMEAIGPGGASLIITNPPMGRRIRVKDMQGLFHDLFAAAAVALRPGGRLVFPNPLRLAPRDPTLRRRYQRTVDLGGFDCRLELYVKESGRRAPGAASRPEKSGGVTRVDGTSR